MLCIFVLLVVELQSAGHCVGFQQQNCLLSSPIHTHTHTHSLGRLGEMDSNVHVHTGKYAKNLFRNTLQLGFQNKEMFVSLINS